MFYGFRFQFVVVVFAFIFFYFFFSFLFFLLWGVFFCWRRLRSDAVSIRRFTGDLCPRPMFSFLSLSLSLRSLAKKKRHKKGNKFAPPDWLPVGRSSRPVAGISFSIFFPLPFSWFFFFLLHFGFVFLFFLFRWLRTLPSRCLHWSPPLPSFTEFCS